MDSKGPTAKRTTIYLTSEAVVAADKLAPIFKARHLKSLSGAVNDWLVREAQRQAPAIESLAETLKQTRS